MVIIRFEVELILKIGTNINGLWCGVSISEGMTKQIKSVRSISQSESEPLML